MHGDAPSGLGGIATAIGTGEAQEAVIATLAVDLVEVWIHQTPPALPQEIPGMDRDTRRGLQTPPVAGPMDEPSRLSSVPLAAS